MNGYTHLRLRERAGPAKKQSLFHSEVSKGFRKQKEWCKAIHQTQVTHIPCSD